MHADSKGMDVINDCRLYFDFMLLSELLVKRKSNFLRKFNSCSSRAYSLPFWLCETCELCFTVIYFLLVKLIKFLFSIILYIATSYGE